MYSALDNISFEFNTMSLMVTRMEARLREMEENLDAIRFILQTLQKQAEANKDTFNNLDSRLVNLEEFQYDIEEKGIRLSEVTEDISSMESRLLDVELCLGEIEDKLDPLDGTLIR